MENKNIKTIKNAEYIRDFCGSMHDHTTSTLFENSTVSRDAGTYLYFLPDAIHELVSVYHFGMGSGNVAEIKQRIYDSLLHSIESYDLDSNNVYIVDDVYETIYNNHPLGSLLKAVADSIMDSDYWRAYVYIKTGVHDDEMKKILSKAINSHKPDKIKVNSKIFDMINN